MEYQIKIVLVQSLSHVQLLDCSMPGFPVYHQFPELAQNYVMPSNHLILCCPLLLLPSVFPRILTQVRKGRINGILSFWF